MSDAISRNSKDLFSDGRSLGGFVGMLVWFNQPEGLVSTTRAGEWALLGVFMGVAVLLGGTVESLLKKSGVPSISQSAYVALGVALPFWCAALGQILAGTTAAWTGFGVSVIVLMIAKNRRLGGTP
ncbi:MAG: hypothetical protein RIC12_00965 [Pirellulales bacterium]